MPESPFKCTYQHVSCYCTTLPTTAYHSTFRLLVAVHQTCCSLAGSFPAPQYSVALPPPSFTLLWLCHSVLAIWAVIISGAMQLQSVGEYVVRVFIQ